MNFKIFVGAAALRWAQTPAHRHEWNTLMSECEWATPCLSADFFQIWSTNYEAIWEPLLVVATSNNGNCLGLMPLGRRGDEITGAGAEQAEYQGWLCKPDEIPTFLDGVATIIFESWPKVHLRLRYVDCGHAQDIFLRWAKNRSNVFLRSHIRPLLKLDAAQIDNVLRKRANRSKMNRLKRNGEIEVKICESDQSVTDIFDTIIRMYDFRQGAANNCCPFSDDEFKRQFHLDIFQRMPVAMPIFILTVGEKIVAALVGLRGPRRVSNAIFAYSPEFARNSPGKFLLYLAAQSLVNTDIDYIDLTPGGDLWKERFATHHDCVYELNIWRNPKQVVIRKLQNALKGRLRKLLVVIGLPLPKLREWFGLVKRVNPKSVWRRIQALQPRRIEYRVYCMGLDELAESLTVELVDTSAAPKVNNFTDLIHFSPINGWQSRQQFLSSALERIERGESVYTIGSANILLHYGWMIREQAKAFFSEVQAWYEYPEPGAVIYDFFTHPKARGRGFYQRSVAEMLHDLNQKTAKDRGARIVYISVLANNQASRHVIEKLGFKYIESVVRISVFGWSRKAIFKIIS